MCIEGQHFAGGEHIIPENVPGESASDRSETTERII